jgi:hypothetical protein
MRELPFTVNVTQELEKIEVENMRAALLGSLTAYTQAIPAMATQGGDAGDVVRKIAAVIKSRQSGRSLEDAIEDIFAPAEQVPSAGAANEMVEQTSPAPIGAPAEGALPGEGGIELPQEEPAPDILSLLSSISGSGEGSASVRTVRRQ